MTVNWKNWKKLLDFIKERKPRQVNMGPYLQHRGIDIGSPSSLPKHTKEQNFCGTVGCIQGWGNIRFARMKFNTKNGVAGEFMEALNIGDSEYQYIVFGDWGSREGQSRYDLGKKEVIKYMEKALKEKNIEVHI